MDRRGNIPPFLVHLSKTLNACRIVTKKSKKLLQQKFLLWVDYPVFELKKFCLRDNPHLRPVIKSHISKQWSARVEGMMISARNKLI